MTQRRILAAALVSIFPLAVAQAEEPLGTANGENPVLSARNRATNGSDARTGAAAPHLVAALPLGTAPLSSLQLSPVTLATSEPALSFSEYEYEVEWGLAPHARPTELDLRQNNLLPESSRRNDAAEYPGNWFVVAGFGLSFTVGLIITISVIHPETKQPRPVFD